MTDSQSHSMAWSTKLGTCLLKADHVCRTNLAHGKHRDFVIDQELQEPERG
jgi:hypothetical protein